jgi:hypothetical protein
MQKARRSVILFFVRRVFFAKTRAFTANLSWSQRRTVVLLMGVGKSALIAADDQVEWLTASRRMTLSSLEVVTLGRPER